MTRWPLWKGWGLAGVFALIMWAGIIAGFMALSGCIATNAIEPVQTPPQAFQHGTIVPVQFADPMTIGLTCAKRGTHPLARSCGNTDMITVQNPCAVPGSGWYAKMLCHELGHANGWSAGHSKD